MHDAWIEKVDQAFTCWFAMRALPNDVPGYQTGSFSPSYLRLGVKRQAEKLNHGAHATGNRFSIVLSSKGNVSKSRAKGWLMGR